jgi:leucine dehydrogenase
MIFQILNDLQYGQLHLALDRETGLRAIVALHSTRLGPAIGGCRVYPYVDEAAAVTDACRLARAMGYKAALARLPHGGGKAVIWATEAMRRGFDRAALFTAFARFVDSLNGAYLTCEDSGTSTSDMDVVRKHTRHVLGTSAAQGGSGDPSPFTALGCRRGIEAVAEVILGRKDGADLSGLHVAIQGVGAVGRYLALELHKLGARLTIADIDPARVERVAAETGAQVVGIDAIFDVECDIFAPCALGGAISAATLPRLRTRAVAGAANNQLESPAIGRELQARGIFYAPDYAINAGGLINVAQEFAGYDADKARHRASGIYATIREIAERTQKSGRPPGEIADELADEIIAAGPQALAK